MNLKENEVNVVQVEGLERKKKHKVKSGRQGSGRYREKTRSGKGNGEIRRIRLALLGGNEHVTPSNTGTTKRNE